MSSVAAFQFCGDKETSLHSIQPALAGLPSIWNWTHQNLENRLQWAANHLRVQLFSINGLFNGLRLILIRDAWGNRNPKSSLLQGWVLGPSPHFLTGIWCPPPRPRAHSLHSLHFLLGHPQEAPLILPFRGQLLATTEEGMEEATRGGIQGIMGTAADIRDMDTTTIHCRGCLAR